MKYEIEQNELIDVLKEYYTKKFNLEGPGEIRFVVELGKDGFARKISLVIEVDE